MSASCVDCGDVIALFAGFANSSCSSFFSMASVEKSLLGTETAQAMRSKGVKSTICGLSANDIRDSFLSSGANDFILKPMPCKPDALKVELMRILQGADR